MSGAVIAAIAVLGLLVWLYLRQRQAASDAREVRRYRMKLREKIIARRRLIKNELKKRFLGRNGDREDKESTRRTN